jgi:hypothetical protein
VRALDAVVGRLLGGSGRITGRASRFDRLAQRLALRKVMLQLFGPAQRLALLRLLLRLALLQLGRLHLCLLSPLADGLVAGEARLQEMPAAVRALHPRTAGGLLLVHGGRVRVQRGDQPLSMSRLHFSNAAKGGGKKSPMRELTS